MAHQLHLEKAEYRQWVKAGLGLGYLKEGLAPFCQDIANQQHKDILDNIQRTKSLPPNVTCGTCQSRSLKPDHVKTGKRLCPYGIANCNCWFPNCKISCQSNICGALYDAIIQCHGSVPPAPNWKNSDSQLWTVDPWSIAKCYINAPGYDQKTSAADIDCTGLLHVIINNKYFHNHIACNLTGPSIFSTVRDHRNKIFHSSHQELEEATANSYIDDMITVLQDGQELVNQPDAQQAVQKLQDLKSKDLIITSESHEELLKQVREDLMHELDELKSTVSTKEEVEELDRKISKIDQLLKQTREDLMCKLNELKSTVSTKQEVEELDRKISNIEEFMKQSKDETKSTTKLLKQIKDELVKSTASTNEKCEGNKRNIETLMSEQEEIKKRLPVEESPDQKQLEYEKAKAEWRNKIIQEYHNTVLKVPAMPLLPDETCEFSQIYVRPTIVSEVKDENRKSKVTKIKSMSEIFSKNGVPLKSVYVLGDAGTGKSSFCKYLVNCWCMAHSEGQILEDEFDGVIEMKKFDFLFLISLRHNQNIDSIHEMLKSQYHIDILGKLLEKESAKMIILLDGLDEWSSEGKAYNQFQTMGLPKYDIYKDYTIVTTSRPWKFHSLRIRDTEIQQMLKLKGFDDKSESEMIKRTVCYINSKKDEIKDIDDCTRKLQEKSLRRLKQVPIMLQQLICLWFDGKLDKTSRCVVYTEMLELFFTWNEDKTADTSPGNADGSQTVELPAYLADKEMCELNSHLIYDMSRLAYETLFNCPRDKSLTFNISVCRKLRITDNVRRGWLKLGILTEEKYPSLSVSVRPKSMFSFIHKSVQEFLAAVNISINFITKMSSSHNFENIDLQRGSIQFVKEVFKNCSTVNEILEQSNVIIMLSGLEPTLATHVSKYIYDIVKEDLLVQRYRKTIDSDISSFNSDYGFIKDIQTLIFDSIMECNTCLVENSPTFYIGDMYMYAKKSFFSFFDDDDRNETCEYCDIVCSSFDQQQITPDFVHSIYVNSINKANVKFSKHLRKFKHLEKIQIDYEDKQRSSSTANVEHSSDEVNKSIVETIEINSSTLKSVSLSVCGIYKISPLCKEVVCILPCMNNLVAIKMTYITMGHDDTTRFCEFLEGTSQLEQIHFDITCECRNQHDVDLSKHQQLQYLYLSGSSTCICETDIDTVNLEVFNSCNIKSTNYIRILDCIRKCDKLNKLELYVNDKNKSQSFHTSITERLVSMLPILHNLSKLDIWVFRLTDNIIQVPSDMKSLKLINLKGVKMSLTTWRKFVDCLPGIPHTVHVELHECCITRDGEEFNDERLSLLGGVVGEKRNEAKQYVKDRKHLFIVSRCRFTFRFSTRK